MRWHRETFHDASKAGSEHDSRDTARSASRRGGPLVALRYSGLGLALLLQCLALPSRALACVVGTGTGASCTESALTACLPGGGSVTFNCGGAATITVTSTKTISADTTIDGGSLITISGGNSVGVFSVNTGVKFTVQNLTIANGNSATAGGGGISNGARHADGHQQHLLRQ